MILIAFALCALAAIVLIALSHTNLQMNAAAVGQAIVYLVITVYILLFVQIPVNTFIVGSGYFFIDHLGLLEVLVTNRYFPSCRHLCPGLCQQSAGKPGAGTGRAEAFSMLPGAFLNW